MKKISDKNHNKRRSKLLTLLAKLESLCTVHAQANAGRELTTSNCDSVDRHQDDESIIIALNGGISSGASPFHIRQWILSNAHECGGTLTETPLDQNDRIIRVHFNSSMPFAVITASKSLSSALLKRLMHESTVNSEAVCVFDGMVRSSVTNGAAESQCNWVGASILQEEVPVFSTAASSSGQVPPLYLLFPSDAYLKSLFLSAEMPPSSAKQSLLSMVHRMPIITLDESLQRFLDDLDLQQQQQPTAKEASMLWPKGRSPRVLCPVAVDSVPGLFVVPEFITPEEHDAILTHFLENGSASTSYDWESMARRTVAHFNRRFYYGVNTLGEAHGDDLGRNVTAPPFYETIRKRLSLLDPEDAVLDPSWSEAGKKWPIPDAFECDQLTVNYYRYSHTETSGIAHHVDAHSPFDDVIFALSLGSHTTMEYKRWDEEKSSVGVFLPPRALLMMTGESRYSWTHCISESRVDVISDLVPPLHRHDRVSLTWRRGRDPSKNPHHKSQCCCPALCDATDK